MQCINTSLQRQTPTTEWCKNRTYNCKKVICSDESSFTMFLSGRVHVWHTLNSAGLNAQPTAALLGGALSWHGEKVHCKSIYYFLSHQINPMMKASVIKCAFSTTMSDHIYSLMSYLKIESEMSLQFSHRSNLNTTQLGSL